MLKVNSICQNGESLPLNTENDLLRVVFIGTGSAFAKRNRKVWTYEYGPIEILIMRTRHFPDSAVSVDESQWCSGVFINRKVWISGDTMFDYEYPTRFAKKAEVMFHDCQIFSGGVHASYHELMTLDPNIRRKMFLYHYNYNWNQPKTWVKPSDPFTGNPVKDGFLGCAQQQVAYDFT